MKSIQRNQETVDYIFFKMFSVLKFRRELLLQNIQSHFARKKSLKLQFD